MATPFYDAATRVTCVPGYNKLLVATLFNPATAGQAVTVVINGVTYSSDGSAGTPFTMTARGTNICWTGTITPTLPVTTNCVSYSWSASQTVSGTLWTDSGSMKSLPSAGTDFAYFFQSCDNNTTYGDAVGPWPFMKSYAQTAGNLPVAGLLFVDDLGYVDGEIIKDDGSGTYASATGLTSGGEVAVTNTVDAYLVGWCSLLGMLGPSSAGAYPGASANDLLYVLWARETSRAWCRKNFNLWPQWGDHEFVNDLGWDVAASDSHFTNGKSAWNAFYGLIQPTTARSADVAANHWAVAIGDVTIASLDGITNSTTTGTVTPNGNAAPVNSAGLTQLTSLFGTNQITDILTKINSLNSKFTCLPLAHGIRYLVAHTGTPPTAFTALVGEWDSGTQHPIYEHCLADFKRLFTASGASPLSLMDNPLTNGQRGVLTCPHGDYHHTLVGRCQAVAYAGNKAEYFYVISLGGNSAQFPSPNVASGSTVADVYVAHNDPLGSSQIRCLRYDIRGSYVNPEQTLTLTDQNNAVSWTGRFVYGTSNDLVPANWGWPKISVGGPIDA